MKSSRFIYAVALVAALAIGVAACGSSSSSTSSSTDSGNSSSGGIATGLSGNLAGAGSSAQQAAQEAWIAGLQNANSGLTISYDPVGSGGGKEQFGAGAVAYAGSDSILDEKDLTNAVKVCGGNDQLVEVPIYISPIAIIYNLSGVDKLQLSADVIAQIFNQKITTWNDQAIADENPGVDLPDTRITPVNRSDDSGTTHNFTDYLAQAAPNDWPYEASDTFPVKGGEAAEGTSGVVDAVKNGDGAIGYADLSQAGSLGIASIKIGDKYVQPTADGAAADLDASKQDSSGGQYELVYSVNRTSTDPANYPITLASYGIACTSAGYSSADDAANVHGLLAYAISPEGQDAAAKNAGSAPIGDKLR